MPVEHYKNFPVASFLLPKRLVPAVEAIYAFARSADDLADEGDAKPEQRLAALTAYELALDAIGRGEVQPDPMFERLRGVIDTYGLPLQPFFDLLSAFKQDVLTTRYANFPALLDYCKRSANPVGLLMLLLYGRADAAAVLQSNAICSALQLINFWQDVAIDIDKERIYIPQDDLQRFGVGEQQIVRREVNPAWRTLMGFEVARARALMHEGSPLVHHLPGRIGWELRVVVQGGLRILDLIEAAQYDVFHHRPQVAGIDWLVIGWRALRM